MAITKITFMSKAKAESTKYEEGAAFISIGDPVTWPATLDPKFKNVLRLEFDDHDPQDNSNLMMPGYIWDDQVLFTHEQAIKAICFVQDLPEDINHLMIHCHMGISRSGAFAVFFNEYLNLNDIHLKRYDNYNRHVYRVLDEAVHGKLGSSFSNEE